MKNSVLFCFFLLFCSKVVYGWDLAKWFENCCCIKVFFGEMRKSSKIVSALPGEFVFNDADSFSEKHKRKEFVAEFANKVNDSICGKGEGLKDLEFFLAIYQEEKIPQEVISVVRNKLNFLNKYLELDCQDGVQIEDEMQVENVKKTAEIVERFLKENSF